MKTVCLHVFNVRAVSKNDSRTKIEIFKIDCNIIKLDVRYSIVRAESQQNFLVFSYGEGLIVFLKFRLDERIEKAKWQNWVLPLFKNSMVSHQFVHCLHSLKICTTTKRSFQMPLQSTLGWKNTLRKTFFNLNLELLFFFFPVGTISISKEWKYEFRLDCSYRLSPCSIKLVTTT